MTSKLLSYLFVAFLMTGFFVSCDEEEDQIEICNNGVDDDGDGQVDCADGDCAASALCSEEGAQRALTGELSSMTMHPDTIYTISRFTYLPSGEKLTILPGTIIKAARGDGANATALIIAAGATIEAKGTKDAPIIFTSIDDKIKVGETASTLNPASDGGKWGGLIVLGNGKISARDDKGGTKTGVEGVPVADYSQYGGSDNEDNSGILEYLSIRFTGTKLENDSEIQGLTLGGVGSKTKIEHIEVISSKDDGIEVFGGAVDIKNSLVIYQSDDGFDFDQSYEGSISNSIVYIYNPAEGNDALELDGPEGSSNTTGKYTIDNCSFINRGDSCRAGTLKSGSQGTISNSAFVGFKNWIVVEGSSATSNYLSENLKVVDCEFTIDVLENAINLIDGDSTQMATAKDLFLKAGNTAVITPTKGSTADFSWTWAAELGLIDTE